MPTLKILDTSGFNWHEGWWQFPWKTVLSSPTCFCLCGTCFLFVPGGFLYPSSTPAFLYESSRIKHHLRMSTLSSGRRSVHCAILKQHITFLGEISSIRPDQWRLHYVNLRRKLLFTVLKTERSKLWTFIWSWFTSCCIHKLARLRPVRTI